MPTPHGSALLDFSCQVKEKAEAFLQNAFDKTATGLISETIDHQTLGLDCSTFGYSDFKIDPDRSLLASLSDFFREKASEMEKDNRRRDVFYDFTFSLSLYPGDTWTLMFYVCEAKNIEEALEEIPGVEEYAYWGNADHPSKVKETEWGTRREDWLSCDRKTPLLIRLGQDRYYDEFISRFRNSDDIVFPDLHSRAKKQAKDILLNKLLKDAKCEDSISIVKQLMDAQEWISSTDEGKQALIDETERVKSLLIQDITFGLVNQPLCKIAKAMEGSANAS